MLLAILQVCAGFCLITSAVIYSIVANRLSSVNDNQRRLLNQLWILQNSVTLPIEHEVEPYRRYGRKRWRVTEKVAFLQPIVVADDFASKAEAEVFIKLKYR